MIDFAKYDTYALVGHRWHAYRVISGEGLKVDPAAVGPSFRFDPMAEPEATTATMKSPIDDDRNDSGTDPATEESSGTDSGEAES